MANRERAPVPKTLPKAFKCTTRLSIEKTTRNAPNARNIIENSSVSVPLLTQII